MHAQQEWEMKLDIASTISAEIIIHAIDVITRKIFGDYFSQNEHTKHQKRIQTVHRQFQFFDDANMSFFRAGHTFRCVSAPQDKDFGETSYDKKKNKRYDFKTGNIESDQRTEKSVWSDAVWPFTHTMPLAFDIPQEMKKIAPVAVAHTTHIKWKYIEGGQTILDTNGIPQKQPTHTLEISFDQFFHPDKTLMFQEIEIEATPELRSKARICIKELTDHFLPEEIAIPAHQKYNRVVYAICNKQAKEVAREQK